MTEQVTGQQSWNGWDLERLRRDGYHEGIDRRIASAVAAILLEDAPRRLGALDLDAATRLHGAELALDGRHGLPLHVLRPGTGTAHTLHTRVERRARMEDWARHVARLHDRAVAYGAEIHAQLDAFDGTAPVLGTDGQPLTGHALAAERLRLWRLFVEGWFYDDPRGRNKAKWIAALRSTTRDPSPHALSADVPTARGQLMDRLDDAAGETRRWLLDDPSGLGAGPATLGQEAALRLLESRRQAGRRSLRAATTLAALRSAATTADTLVRGVGIEDGPAWQTSTGTALTGGRHAVTAPAPGASRWAYALRCANPPPTVASKPAAALGDVVLDAVDAPAGWAVTSTPRPTPDEDERDVVIAQAAAPEAGTYEFTLTARNACGPSRLAVTITVPAAPAEESS